MSPLLELPPEILVDILSRLERTDQKQFRLTSRVCEQLTTPLVYDEIRFDLDPGGCDGLISIAKSPSLSRHVQTVRLQRRVGLQIFTTFESWERANIYEYFELDFEGHPEPIPIIYTTKPMSWNEWAAMDHDERKALFNEYESDLHKIEAYTSRLASALSALLGPSSLGREQIRNDLSDAQRVLCAFAPAIKALSNVHTLAYTPSYEYGDWGRTWRNVEFHGRGLECYAAHSIDPNIDALQLFIALRTVILAPNALHSVDLFTQGHAFWSVPYLQRLLDWKPPFLPSGSPLDLTDEDHESWAGYIGSPLKHAEMMTRQLVALGRGFSRLTSLHCRVNTFWSHHLSELMTIAKTLSNMLQETVKLKKLELIYRDDALSDNAGICIFPDCTLIPEALKDNVKEHITVSKYLLLDSAPFLRHLRRLHLSLATVVPHLLGLFAHLHHLNHLKLDHVALLPGGGQWEAVLAWLAEHLHLTSIKLQALEDTCDQKPRLLLCPRSSEWSTNGLDNNCYNDYEDSIVCYALRQSNSVPILSPAEFLQSRFQSNRSLSSTP